MCEYQIRLFVLGLAERQKLIDCISFSRKPNENLTYMLDLEKVKKWLSKMLEIQREINTFKSVKYPHWIDNHIQPYRYSHSNSRYIYKSFQVA